MLSSDEIRTLHKYLDEVPEIPCGRGDPVGRVRALIDLLRSTQSANRTLRDDFSKQHKTLLCYQEKLAMVKEIICGMLGSLTTIVGPGQGRN